MKKITWIGMVMLLSCILAIPVFAQTATPASPDTEAGTQTLTPAANVERSDEANPAQLTAEDAAAFIRFAHVVADSPPVDLYVTELGDAPLIQNLAFGEVTDFVFLPEGNFTVIAREAGSAADSEPLATLDWELSQDTSWLVSFAGLMSNVSLQIETTSLLRNDIADDMARVRVINFASGADPLTISTEAGDDFGQELGWMGVFDADITPGTYNLNIATPDNASLLENLPIDLPAGQLSTLLVVGGMNGITVLPFHSQADAGRVQIVNNTSEPIDIFRRPDDERVVAGLEPGATSEWISVPSGSTTFVAYAPGTGTSGQELAAWIGEVKPLRDATITFQPEGVAEQTDMQFTSSMMPESEG